MITKATYKEIKLSDTSILVGHDSFCAGTITSFMKLWPSLVPYEYGFRVVLFTFCLIVVSGYRISMGNPMRTAMDRLYSIAIGGFVAVLVNVLVCPIWAGEQLHKELVNSFDSVAASLEGKILSNYVNYRLIIIIDVISRLCVT